MQIRCSSLKLKLSSGQGPVAGTGVLALGLALALPGLSALSPAATRPKPAAAELVLGQSAAFSGPSAMLGKEYREGALAYFAEVNRQGGIHGRRLKLLSLDDRYEPPLTLRNTRQLIERDKVFALFGYVGTPTVKAVLPLVESQKIPMIAPLTGAQLLRQPHRPRVFNLRASYHT